jgi:hypothetical protein
MVNIGLMKVSVVKSVTVLLVAILRLSSVSPLARLVVDAESPNELILS